MNGIPNQSVGMRLADFSYLDTKVDPTSFGFKPIEPKDISKDNPHAFGKDWNQQRGPGVGGIGEVVQNRFEILINDKTHQIVISFKGSDAASNWRSDLLDDGAGEYQKIYKKVQAAYDELKKNPYFQDYKISTTGHSMGGGMAQTFALKNGLDAQVYNSLPVAIQRLEPDYFGPGGIEGALEHYKAAGHTVSDVRTPNDIATFYYDKVLGGTYLAAQIGQSFSMLPGAEIPPAMKFGLLSGAVVVGGPLGGAATVGGLAVTGMDHTMGRMFDAQQGLSTDPLTGRYLVPEGSGARAINDRNWRLAA